VRGLYHLSMKVTPAAALKQIRRICLSFPEAHEKVAWSAPTFRVKDKLFAMFHSDHHGDGRLAVWCKAPPGMQETLVKADPKYFFRPPYVGPSGWIGIELNKGLEWGVVASFLAEAYRMTAPKKLAAMM